MSSSQLRKKYWFYALGWVGLIYATLYWVRLFSDFFRDRTPYSALTTIFVVAFFLAVVIYVGINFKIKKRSTYILLAIMMAVYAMILPQIRYPDEKVHLVQYGILAFLLFRALKVDFSVWVAYLGAFLLTSLFGWGDEGIQHLLPNRYYSLDDVLLNSLSGFLGLVLVFIFQREVLE